MGIGFRLDLKLGLPLHSHFSTNTSPAKLSSASGRGRDTSINLARLSSLSNVTEVGEALHKEPWQAYTSSILTLGNEILEMEKTKVTTVKRPYISLNDSANDSKLFSGENKSTSNTGLEADTSSQFNLLLENLNALEETIGDADVLHLEKDILLQLGRLGALKLFQTCLSRSFDASDDFNVVTVPTKHYEEGNMSRKMDGDDVRIVRSGKKEVRASKRERALKKADRSTMQLLPSTSGQKQFLQPASSSAKRASNSKKRRLMVARNEAEMSKGVKAIAKLERIRQILEDETGQVVTLGCWAEAAGVDEKVLQRSLHFGWFCRDEILKSTRSLVLYLARNYRGLGIALEDLIQAGNFGVLLGAERFDHTRGYRFSTYVQYWIRKSMSRMVAKHARGIRIPYTLGNAMNQIQKARRALHYHNGKYPDDKEIAKRTGFTVAKVKSASKCLRVVGSIDQKVGDGPSAKYMELMPDQTMRSPEELVMRHHMRNDIYQLLNNLDSREKQVVMLRHGLKDHQPKSLEEIGRIFRVSKEWIRKIEIKALKKLRDQDNCLKLSHYRNI